LSRAAPRVEFLWWEQCPSWERALAQLRGAMIELGLDPDSVEVVRMDTDEQAREREFIGSPTIRIDGRDVQPPGPDEAAGLACRVYRHRDGRISPLPDPADVADALRAAIGEGRRSG
jgi:hypothetical protein